MTVDEGLKELANQQYPHTVDVVQGVMAQVSAHPYLQPRRQVAVWQRVVSATMAAAIAALIVNFVVLNMRSYDEDDISYMISQVHDYNYYNAVEEAAENPIAYLYEE